MWNFLSVYHQVADLPHVTAITLDGQETARSQEVNIACDLDYMEKEARLLSLCIRSAYDAMLFFIFQLLYFVACSFSLFVWYTYILNVTYTNNLITGNIFVLSSTKKNSKHFLMWRYKIKYSQRRNVKHWIWIPCMS